MTIGGPFKWTKPKRPIGTFGMDMGRPKVVIATNGAPTMSDLSSTQTGSPTQFPDPAKSLDLAEKSGLDLAEKSDPPQIEAVKIEVRQAEIPKAEIRKTDVPIETPVSSPVSAPHVSRAAALHDEIAKVDIIPTFGRLLPHLDEAYAALFGADRWTSYLATTGSGAVRRLSAGHPSDPGALLYDRAPHRVVRAFDQARGLLTYPLGTERRPGCPRDIVMAMLRDRIGPQTSEGEAFNVALRRAAELQLDDRLHFSDLGQASDAVDATPILNDAGMTHGLVGTLQGVMREAPFLGARSYGATLTDEDLGQELFLALVETLHHARAAANVFDAAIHELPYYGMVEDHGLRFMTFAGANMMLAFMAMGARGLVPNGLGLEGHGDQRLDCGLALAPTTARVAVPGSSEGRSSYAPDPFAGGTFDAAAFEAAFAAVRGWFPIVGTDPVSAVQNGVRVQTRDTAHHPYRAADLAEGFEHLRTLAFALVTIRTAGSGLVTDQADRRAAAEFEFWRAGLETAGSGGPSVWGFAPMIFGSAIEAKAILSEPLGVMPQIRARRREAGLDDREGAVAAAMRDLASGFDVLPPFVGYLRQNGTTTAFQRKVAKARREIAEREAQGLPGIAYPPPKVKPEVSTFPVLGTVEDEDDILRLLPKDKCLPRLKAPRLQSRGYQLEEPQFAIDARARRVAADAIIKKAKEDAADALAQEVAEMEQD